MQEAAFDSVVSQLLPLAAPGLVGRAVAQATGIRQISRIYAELQGLGDATPISSRLLAYFDVDVRVADVDLQRIPKSGPVLLVANHPFGILEGAVLADLLSRLRGDVQFLANGILTAIPELREMVIPVDPFGAPHNNRGGIRQAVDHLAAGGLLVIFPAGEVAHFQWKERAITDPKWNPAVARMLALAARRAKNIAVVPVYVEGSNSLLFQAAGMLHARLRTVLLGRELLNKRRSRVAVRIGGAIAAEKLLAIPSAEERTQYLRWRTYLLAARDEFKPRTALPLANRKKREQPEPIAGPISAAAMEREVQALTVSSLLGSAGDLRVYLAEAAEIPNVLREIGRLREVTFRAAGEGTGKAFDLDHYDSRYLHLFVWNTEKKELVGAYRLAGVDTVRSSVGFDGLYTASLFRYGDDFLDRLGPALELGRSFVRAEYQRAFQPLLLLWKGIGKYVARNPRYKILFGPVSISNQYHSLSRQLMVNFLERFAALEGWMHLVSTRNPFRARRLPTDQQPAFPRNGFDLDDLSTMIADLEPGQPGVPVLLRQYLKLGGKLLGFNVDPAFANALDGLILVDLTQTEGKLLERYLGKNEAAQFLAYQKGIYGAQ